MSERNDEQGSEKASDGGRRGMRKDEIRAVATRLFAERGYEGASMGDLAEEVGIRKASLFHHFESKQALYADVLNSLLSEVARAISSSTEGGLPYPEQADRIVDSLNDLLFHSPYAARLLLREAMNINPETRDVFLGALRVVYRTGVDFIERGQQERAFTSGLSAEHAVLSLVGVLALPFGMPGTMEPLYGASPFNDSFLEIRKREVRLQTRLLLIGK